MQKFKGKKESMLILLEFKPIMLGLLLYSILSVNSVMANQSCEVATTPKVELVKKVQLEQFFGDRAWEVRLASAELIQKFGSKNKGSKVQLNHSTQVLLNSIVTGSLVDGQASVISDHREFLENAIQLSVLVSRARLSSDQPVTMAPKLVSDALVSINVEPAKAESRFYRFFGMLNPFSYFSKKAKDLKKYGPVVPYVHAEQMVELLKSYKESERLAVLKYMLEPVEMLSPIEIIKLTGEVAKESQLAAFDFLNAKLVGRYEFFDETHLNKIKINLNPKVILKILSGTSSTWGIAKVMLIVGDVPEITSTEFAAALKTNISPIEILDYLNTQEYFSLRESELLLKLLVENAHDLNERNQFYTAISAKIYLAEDKKTLENIFAPKVVAEIKKTSGGKNIQLSNFDFNQLKAKTKSEDSIISLMESRLKSGVVQSARDFIDTLDPIKPNPGSYFKEEISNLWSGYASQFVALKPTNEEFDLAKRRIKLEDDIITLMEAQIKSGNLKTAADFIKTLDPAKPNPGSYYREEIDLLWLNYRKEFVRLNPTNVEFNLIKTIIKDEDTIVDLMRARLEFGSLQDGSDVVETFRPVKPNPSSYYRELIDDLKTEYFENH